MLQRVLQALRAGGSPAPLLGKFQTLGTPRDCIRDSSGWCRDEVKLLDLCLEGRVPLILKCLMLWEAGLGECCQLHLCTPLPKHFPSFCPGNCEFGVWYSANWPITGHIGMCAGEGPYCPLLTVLGQAPALSDGL